MAQRVSNSDFEANVLHSDIPVLVDFYTDSCIACKRITPALGDLEDQYEGRLWVVKVNTNFEPELSERYDILSNPTLILIKNGNEVARRIGQVSYQDLEDWVLPYLDN